MSSQNGDVEFGSACFDRMRRNQTTCSSTGMDGGLCRGRRALALVRVPPDTSPKQAMTASQTVLMQPGTACSVELVKPMGEYACR